MISIDTQKRGGVMMCGFLAKTGLVISGIASLVFLAGCGGGSSQSVNNQFANPAPQALNPTPTITTISPNTTVVGGGAFTLTINGTDFVAGSIVNFGGSAIATTFGDSALLTATIPAASVASVGTPAVTVTNPSPGGGTSVGMSFSITSTSPIPTVNLLYPSCAPAGEQLVDSADNQMEVGGLNFETNSVVRWNGADRPTTFVDGTALTAQISASDIAAAGTAAVTVLNPAPGGGSSNSLTFNTMPEAVDPQSIAVDPAGKFAYVANSGCDGGAAGYVSVYTIDAATGALVSIGPPVPSLYEGASSVAVDPLGKFAYVADTALFEIGGDVSMYTINAATGALTSTGSTSIGFTGGAGLLAPLSIAVDPSGKFAYVANEGGFAPTSISMYIINSTTGGLDIIGSIAAGGRAISVTVDPKGGFAYVASKSDPPGSVGNVSAYTIEANTGALTSIGTVLAGTDPNSVVVDPTGKFAYVANSSSNDVSMYTINAATGALTSIGTVPAGSGPNAVVVDPTGKFAYVTNFKSSDVSMYAINVTTGALTLKGTIAAGQNPSSITVHPSGKFAYVTNSVSNDISIYGIDTATGALALIATVGT
ncbi:MAG: beta-propeller fold lactonase family protein [Candidatus Acidiferrales bacterium]